MKKRLGGLVSLVVYGFLKCRSWVLVVENLKQLNWDQWEILFRQRWSCVLTLFGSACLYDIWRSSTNRDIVSLGSLFVSSVLRLLIFMAKSNTVRTDP